MKTEEIEEEKKKLENKRKEWKEQIIKEEKKEFIHNLENMEKYNKRIQRRV